MASDGRVYIDHSRDIGEFNPCFPTYEIRVDGDRASGRSTFPLVYEGPPGIVHGGFLALFFDCVIQHHNCDLGHGRQDRPRSASTTGVRRRSSPSSSSRWSARSTDRRITSTARLMADGVVLCEAE